MEKLECCGYPTVKTFWKYVYWFRQNTRTWQTDGQTDRHRTTAQAALMHSIAREKQRCFSCVREIRVWRQKRSHEPKPWFRTCNLWRISMRLFIHFIGNQNIVRETFCFWINAICETHFSSATDQSMHSLLHVWFYITYCIRTRLIDSDKSSIYSHYKMGK